MKALTLHQPWASLCALGVKTIETRSWSTRYRGPLAIHAAKRQPEQGKQVGEWKVQEGVSGWLIVRRRESLRGGKQVHVEPLPLGAVVATARLVDVVPIIDMAERDDETERTRHVAVVYNDGLTVTNGPLAGQRGYRAAIHDPAKPGFYKPTDQLPYGDFTPGRFAWLLEDVKATEQRCPMCWGSGDGEVCPCMEAGPRYGDLGPDHDGSPIECPDCYQGRRPCPTCDGSAVCPPVPAKGHQGLWSWTP